MKPKPHYFGALRERLSRLILARGVTNSSLARAIGRNPSQLTNYLNGKDCPPPPVIHKLAEALDVDWRVLIGEMPLPPDVAAPEDPPGPAVGNEEAGQGGRLPPFTHRTRGSGLNEPPAGRIPPKAKRGQERKP